MLQNGCMADECTWAVFSCANFGLTFEGHQSYLCDRKTYMPRILLRSRMELEGAHLISVQVASHFLSIPEVC